MARTCLWLPLAVLSLTPLRALDLTPQHTHRELEGFRIPVVRFRDRDQNITYQPPTGWRVTGSEKSLQLIPPDREYATVQFRVERLPASAAAGALPPDADQAETEPALPTRQPAPAAPGAAPADLEAWARALLPPTATQVERLGEASNVFMLGAASSREITFTYTLPTGRFVIGVAAVDLSEKERLAVVTTARREDFKKVHDDAIASLFSWQIGE